MSTAIVGLFAGLFLGLSWAVAGFSGLLLTAFVAGVGFLVGKVLDGEIDVPAVLDSAQRRTSNRAGT